MRRIAITGYGTITPAGIGHKNTWEHVISGKNFIRKIERFNPDRFVSQTGGEVKNFYPQDFISKRLIKKTDRFTHFALAASQMAIDNANINLEQVDRERVGVTVGNMFGGWEFAEKELENFWTKGKPSISPYQATAWFQTAAQGQITIQQGIKGRSRTLIADRASGAAAISEAAQTIERDKADVMLAGGSEAPFSPFGWLCCQTSGYLANTLSEKHPENVYCPFDRKHKGSVFGEGSSFIILENWEHATERGANILAELSGWSMANDAYYPYYTVRPDGKVLADNINRALQKSKLNPKDIDYISAHGSALPSEDSSEVLAYKKVFNKNISDIPISIPKTSFGHLLGAAGPTDVMLTINSILTGTLPPTINYEKPSIGFEDILINVEKKQSNVQNSLVISRGMGGGNVSLVVSKV